MKIEQSKRYKCSWPDGKTNNVLVIYLLKQRTWARITWHEEQNSVRVQMNDNVPVDWLSEVETDIDKFLGV